MLLSATFIKLLRALIIIALFVFAALIAAGRAGLLIKPVKNIIIGRLERMAGIELKIGKIEGNLVTGMRLKNVAVSRKGALQARAEILDIKYFLPTLILRGTAGVQLLNVEIPQLPGLKIIKSAGTVALTKKGFEAKRFVIASAGSMATVDAFAATGSPPRWEIAAGNVSISLAELTKDATGSVKMKLKLSGDDNGLALNTEILRAQVNTTRLTGGQITLTLDKNRNISMEATAQTVTGSAHISVGGNANAVLKNDDTPAIRFKTSYTGNKIAAFIEGMLRKGGDNSFVIAVSSAMAATQNTVWIDAGHGMAKITKNGLKDARFTVARGELSATIAGEVSANRLNVRLQSAWLPIKELERIFSVALPAEIVSADGMISADISATGTPASPEIEGYVIISGGRFALLSTNVEYRELAARLKISVNTLSPPAALVTIEECAFKGGDGTAKISGTVEIGAHINTNIILKCTNFTVMNTDIFSGNIDAVIALNGNNVTGHATVRRATINIPLKIKAPLEEIEIIYTTGTANVRADDAPSIFSGAIVDIEVDLPGATNVKAADSEAEVQGKLRVHKERNGPPRLSGEVDAVRGAIRIGERRLAITEASALFTGGPPEDAEIGITAEGRISDALITLRLAGTIREPDVVLSSEPPMDEADILSYLVFGKRLDRLAVTQEQSLHGTALDILGNIGARGIERLVGKDLAPEEISISPSTGAIGIGKYVTDRLYVTYEWNAADEQPRAMFDYRVNRFLSLRSQSGNPRDSGIDLLWKFSY